MAGGPERRKAGTTAGVALAIGIAVAVTCSALGTGKPAAPTIEARVGTVRPDGKLVLRVFVPKLY